MDVQRRKEQKREDKWEREPISAGSSVELLPRTLSSLLVFGLICEVSGTVGGAGARIVGCAGLKDYPHLVHKFRITHSDSLNQIHLLPALPPNHTVCCVPGFLVVVWEASASRHSCPPLRVGVASKRGSAASHEPHHPIANPLFEGDQCQRDLLKGRLVSHSVICGVNLCVTPNQDCSS